MIKNCCESCKVGLLVASTTNRCTLDPFYFGAPWDEVYTNCCNEIKGDDEFILTEEDESNYPYNTIMNLILSLIVILNRVSDFNFVSLLLSL